MKDRHSIDRGWGWLYGLGLLASVLFLLAWFPQPAHAQTTVDIHAIQTDLPDSPYLGQTVITSGIVIAVLSDGFYIENPTSDFDSDTCTAEGIFVYTPTGVPSNAVLQNKLTVTGVVEKSNNSDRAGTQIYIASPVVGTNVVTAATGQTLPSAIASSVITESIDEGACSNYTAGSFGQWLPFEGMRVNVPSSSSLMVTQGTGGTVTPATQTAATNGQFWAVFTTTRPFRAAGIDVLDPAASSAPSTVTVWNGNPQLLLVDSTTLGGTALDASAGTKYTGSSNLVGIVDYHVSTQGYTGLLLTSDSVSALSSQSGATPVAASARLSTDQITFATLDLNSLVVTETNRVAKLANAVVNYMQSPDVLAVQGATPAALSLLLSAVSSAGGPGYSFTTNSTADSSGLVNTFLVNPDKFDGMPTAAQALASNTYTTTSNTVESLFARSPLVLTASIPRTGIADYTMYVVNANLMDRTDLAATSTSEDARIRREQQAELLATQVLEPLEALGDHVMVVGGFNSFEFSDGYVDTLGIVDGSEPGNVTSSTVWLYDSTYNTSTLVNSTTSATNLTAAATNPSTSRYTYVESGSAEQLDHILYTGEMSSLVSIDYARIGADFPISETYDTATVARASSHDAVIAYFTVPYPTMTQILSNTPNPSYYGEDVTFTVKVCVVATSSSTTCIDSAGYPDGTVTFTDSVTGDTLGTATLSSGQATFVTSVLTVGTHTITATYGGSASNLGYQSSSATTQQVVVAYFSLTATPSSYTIYTGEKVTSTITVVPQTGFTLNVALTCSGVPANTTCTLSPSTITGGSGTATLVIQTTAPSRTTTASNHRPWNRTWPLLAGLLLLIAPKRLRRWRAWTMTLLFVAALAASTLAGCGNSGTLTGGTSAGAYTITVTGTAVDGTLTLTKTATVTLNVKSMF